jgi:hypothetical protein
LIKIAVLKGTPIHCLECIASKEGFVKIKLFYLTDEPKHIRSYVLQHTYGLKGPYLEDVSVLIPQEKVFPELSYFIPAFTKLQIFHIVSSDSQLTDFKILDEDNLTLSYVLDALPQILQ